MKTLNLKVKI